jgi:hypothetical protein
MIVVDFENSQKIGLKRGRDEDQNDSHKKHMGSQSSNDSTIPFNLEKTQQNARKTTPEEMKMRASRLYKMGAGGSRKVVQSIDFQPDENTQYENSIGEWINCNTIPASHPPNLCYGGGEPDTDIISFDSLYDNSLGRYNPGTLYLGNGLCTSWKNYVEYFGSQLDQNRINYKKDFILNPVTQQEFKCGNGMYTFEHLRRIIPSQYKRINKLIRKAESLLEDFDDLQVDNLDENLRTRLFNQIGGPEGHPTNYILQLEILSFYLRNVLIDIYEKTQTQINPDIRLYNIFNSFVYKTYQRRMKIGVLNTPALDDDDDYFLLRFTQGPGPMFGIPNFTDYPIEQTYTLMRTFIQTIKQRLGVMKESLNFFLAVFQIFMMPNPQFIQNMGSYVWPELNDSEAQGAAVHIKGVSSIVYILDHLEWIFSEIQNKLDIYLGRPRNIILSDDDTSESESDNSDSDALTSGSDSDDTSGSDTGRNPRNITLLSDDDTSESESDTERNPRNITLLSDDDTSGSDTGYDDTIMYYVSDDDTSGSDTGYDDTIMYYV